MKVGDKIICINIDGCLKKGLSPLRNLTLNKVYTIVDMEIDNPGVLNDNGEKTYYHKTRFISVQERRDLVILSLLEKSASH
jgi:hypothetical protein